MADEYADEFEELSDNEFNLPSGSKNKNK